MPDNTLQNRPTGPTRRRTLNGRVVGATVLAAGTLALAPAFALDAVLFAAANLVRISPVVLLALLLTSWATASGATGLIAASFAGREARMIVVASLIGALTPVCGMTMFPIVAGLLAARVSLAPIMAFWLSSPITDPGMLAITAATLGLPFAIGKAVAAFASGLVGGGISLAATRSGLLANPAKERTLAALSAHMSCGRDAPASVAWRFWRDRSRLEIFRASTLETGRVMVTWLAIAFVAEFYLKAFLPEAWVVSLVGGDSALAVPIAATLGAPIYLDGYAALPLIRGLIEAGMRPDAAMAFLIAGGITSAWAAIPVYSLVRRPVFVLYLALAVGCSMLSGYAYGLFAGG